MDWYDNSSLYQGAVAAAAASAPNPAELQRRVEGRLSIAIQKTRGCFGPYFSVTESYVATKILVLLFPFITRLARARRSMSHLDLSRAADLDTARRLEEPAPQRSIGDTDLYIPVLAAVTHVLLHGASRDVSGSFTPAILSERISITVAVVLIEMTLLWTATFALGGDDKGLVDCLALVSYKFVHLSAIGCAYLLCSRLCYSVVLYYCICGAGVTAGLLYTGHLGEWRRQVAEPEWRRKASDQHKMYIAWVLALCEVLLVFFFAPGVQ